MEIPLVNMKIHGNKLRMTADTGATKNVLDRRTFDQMTNIDLQPSNAKACTYNTTTPLKFSGKFEAAILDQTQIYCGNVLCGTKRQINLRLSFSKAI